MPTPVAADTPVGLTEVAAGTARYYSDAACTARVTSTTIPAGQTNGSFYVKPFTGGTTVQIASASFGSAQRTLDIIGAVRRASCSFSSPVALPDGGTTKDYSASCTLSPAHQSTGRTALFFQATSSTGTAGTAMVRCRLTSTATVTCNRNDGTSSGTVRVQTIELPTGLRVERVTGNCQAAHPFTATLPAAVDPAKTFLLKSYQNSSGDIDDDDLLTAQLVSPTSLSLDFGSPTSTCSNGSYEIQAVELSGLTVKRGTEDAGIPINGATASITGLDPVSLNTALLTQHTVPNTNNPICSVLARSQMPSPSSLSFSRAAGATGACLTTPIFRFNWEQLDFGSRAIVQTRTVTMPINTSSTSVAISPVDVTRTLVFASSQAASGQGNGETSYTAGGNLGDGNARFELTSSTSVNVVRQRNLGVGIFTFYVVELEP